MTIQLGTVHLEAKTRPLQVHIHVAAAADVAERSHRTSTRSFGFKDLGELMPVPYLISQ